MKLIVSLLALFLIFLLGSAQAQTGENNTSQNENLSTDETLLTLANKMLAENITGNMTCNITEIQDTINRNIDTSFLTFKFLNIFWNNQK